MEFGIDDRFWKLGSKWEWEQSKLPEYLTLVSLPPLLGGAVYELLEFCVSGELVANDKSFHHHSIHLRYKTPSLRCKESQRAQYRYVAGVFGASSGQNGRSSEFSFFSRIGLIAGSSSWVFWT
ncbi:hypothetical protein AVEN_188273-1 [Araneus ventricosus]|uniref:Uncharacterized protein n=1 Tax=Araneus ventricosus TaxID=182803 RepID=A0A4Y2S4T1_ARAVE|nr:hypothetical protein AVEN_188273-1 [Araneus ventricosus]